MAEHDDGFDPISGRVKFPAQVPVLHPGPDTHFVPKSLASRLSGSFRAGAGHETRLWGLGRGSATLLRNPFEDLESDETLRSASEDDDSEDEDWHGPLPQRVAERAVGIHPDDLGLEDNAWVDFDKTA
jgi:hypothetical protein